MSRASPWPRSGNRSKAVMMGVIGGSGRLHHAIVRHVVWLRRLFSWPVPLLRAGTGGVQRYGLADKGLQRLRVDLLSFPNVDRAHRVAPEAGVEQTGGVGKQRA